MRIIVAMSGGVDSSVTAGLLLEAGHEVIGATLQLYDYGQAVSRKTCCAGRDIYDAKEVAARLNIPHYVVNAEERFYREVMEDFADSYLRGETPVPCLRCNEGVKFGGLMKLAKETGAEALATGHYVRRKEGKNGAELWRATDLSRDQSWFLFSLSREMLNFCLFPLGDFKSKAEVRLEAERMGLTVAKKADSQDICFVPTGKYPDVIAKIRPEQVKPGEIVSEDGKFLAPHKGIIRYTLGQVKRLGFENPKGEDQQAVVRIDPLRNLVVVGPKKSPPQIFTLREVNWLIDEPKAPETLLKVKLRARDELHRAAVQKLDGDLWQVRLLPATAEENGENKARPVFPTPGQACVFYQGEQVLGGGIIRPLS